MAVMAVAMMMGRHAADRQCSTASRKLPNPSSALPTSSMQQDPDPKRPGEHPEKHSTVMPPVHINDDTGYCSRQHSTQLNVSICVLCGAVICADLAPCGSRQAAQPSLPHSSSAGERSLQRDKDESNGVAVGKAASGFYARKRGWFVCVRALLLH